ncbi:MAG: hypothetical protein JSV33_14805 [bacterium]|nr:MAG: hypothetical protein JSV33_14805 [bacterium]
MSGNQKKFVFTVVSIVLGICFLELFSVIFFRSFRARFSFYKLEQYVVDEKDIDSLGRYYDSRLGWDYHYETEYTERPHPVTYGRPLMATFGDSFMHGTDVNDDETWQVYLSSLVQADVFNFGTGGFGPDQAYLKYISITESLEVPVAVLGVNSENINRLVNVYRPFYFPKTGIKLPKPRFMQMGGRMKLIPNPIRSIEDIGLLTDVRFVQGLGAADWWYNKDNYPIYRFPYLRILFNKRMWLEALYGKEDRRIDDTNPRPWEDLWQEEEPVSLMYSVMDSFIGDVRSRGAVPIIMIMPLQDEVFQKYCTNTYPASVTMVADYCTQKVCLCFNSIDALAGKAESIDEIPDLFIVHVSPRGNRIIAEAFFRFLEEHLPRILQ